MDDGRDVTVNQPQPVVSIGRDGLVCKTKSMERSIEPVSTAITSKNPAGAISAVCCWSQTDYEQPGSRTPEARDRFPPIAPSLEAIHLFPCDFFTPLHQSWASEAPRDLLLEFSDWLDGSLL